MTRPPVQDITNPWVRQVHHPRLATICIGLYLGWTTRGRTDQWQLDDADKVIGQAITDRQASVDLFAAAKAHLMRIQIDAELRQLLDNEER